MHGVCYELRWQCPGGAPSSTAASRIGAGEPHNRVCVHSCGCCGWEHGVFVNGEDWCIGCASTDDRREEPRDVMSREAIERAVKPPEGPGQLVTTYRAVDLDQIRSLSSVMWIIVRDKPNANG